MSESVVADFVAEALHADGTQAQPARVRVLLSEERLVLAGDEGRRSIPLADVYDVTRSAVPDELADFLDQTVLVGYRHGDGTRRVVISGNHESIRKFTSLLYRLLLGGTRVLVRHPTMRGGRVLEAAGREALVDVGGQDLKLAGPDVELRVPRESVVGVDERVRTVEGEPREVIELRYDDDGTELALELCHEANRRQTVLWRYLRQQFFDAESRATSYDTAPIEDEILLALYTGLEPEELVAFLEMDPGDVGTILRALRDEELVDDVEAGALTTAGRVGAVQYFRSTGTD